MTWHNKSEQQVLFNLVVLRYFFCQADLGLEQCSRARLVKRKSLRPFNDTTISPETCVTQRPILLCCLLRETALVVTELHPKKRQNHTSKVPPYKVASARQVQERWLGQLWQNSLVNNQWSRVLPNLVRLTVESVVWRFPAMRDLNMSQQLLASIVTADESVGCSDGASIIRVACWCWRPDLSVDDSFRKGKGDSSQAFPQRKTSVMVVVLARR